MKELRKLLPNKLKDVYNRNPYFTAIVEEHMQINMYGFTNSAYIRMLEAAIFELDNINRVNIKKLIEIDNEKRKPAYQG